eukprot:TRINITY_DN12049_c0_g2_i1.p1 TRINITY_DN12049_c0_g2~~TRINITY_DN12049_c0_g2_i1.p1  ORF type:complete len:116 (+),score=39.96 TRINITY_DN12049_c0_g2_i1:2-349(+)
MAGEQPKKVKVGDKEKGGDDGDPDSDEGDKDGDEDDVGAQSQRRGCHSEPVQRDAAAQKRLERAKRGREVRAEQKKTIRDTMADIHGDAVLISPLLKEAMETPRFLEGLRKFISV